MIFGGDAYCNAISQFFSDNVIIMIYKMLNHSTGCKNVICNQVS